ncbi:PEP/pyruvate-binding domain-containing protein [Streptomyces sp. NPDC020898]|uniref:PEP/pyruvate-binding domain-containing protein n=1 Tax=Streptomyces sp. NPDC020898 TaxID=3365101 RepID=UPI003791B07F
MRDGSGTDWLIGSGAGLVDPLQVGHKFARQAVLGLEGFPIPPFACVPAAVFDRVVRPELPTPPDSTSPDWGTSSASAVAERARALQSVVHGLEVPQELREALDRRFDELAGPGGLVAVRACVVPRPGDQELGEDSAQDPFAGLSDSFLYVGREGLADRILSCWASAFNPEAALYRARQGLDPFSARVAVGVQRMVMGVRSFVAFTRDPRAPHDSARRCVIAAAHGIGEGVVQEKADVDHFFVDPVAWSIEAHVVVKSRAVGWDPARPDQGPVAVPVDARQAPAPVLSDTELKEISTLALRVEKHFGEPQDIEGTITEDGGVHLVQARPIVTAPRASTTPPDHSGNAGGILWDNNNVTESYPGVSSALTFSVARTLYELGFGDLYRRMGVPARLLEHNRPLLRRMVGHLDGRVYYQLDSWYRLHGQIRCFRPLWSTWEQSLGLVESGRLSSASRRRGPLPRLADAVHLAEILGRLMAHPRRVRRFLQWWDSYHPQFSDVSAMRPHEAVEAYRTLWAQVSRRWGVTLVNGLFLFTVTWAANGLLRRWLPEAGRSLLNGMLVGGPDNRSAAALRSAIALAETAAASPDLRTALLSDQDPEKLWRRLTEQGHDEPFVSAMRRHVQHYGDRGLHDLKLETLTPRDQPWTVLHTVRAYLRQGLTVEGSRTAGREIRRQAEQELRGSLRNPLKRAVLRGTFGIMRMLTRVREDTRFCRSQLIGDVRVLLMRLGEELAAAGRLDRPRDVLDLTADEVLGAFDGTLAGADLRGLAAVRAAERARWTAGDPLPPRMTTDGDLPLATALRSVTGQDAARQAVPEDGTAPSRLLTGLASSSGTVRGTAKIVLDPSVNADECQGRILVARETDPGWLFLMMTASALVVERGTLLSHTAITGRLLGIPTVVAVRDATNLIADGSLIEVDGSSGTVRILDGAS